MTPEPASNLLPVLLVFLGGPLLIWRMRRRPLGRGGSMRVTSRTALSKNGVIAVVEVDGKRLLVGATDHQIAILQELPDLPQPEESAKPAHRARFGPRMSPLEELRRRTLRTPTRPRPPRVTLS